MPLLPAAHESWFVRDDGHLDWSFATEASTVALLALALALAVGARLASRLWPGVDIPFLGRLAPYMPFAVRIHLAVSMLGLLSLGHYLSPAMALHKDVAGVLLGAVMAVVAVGMVTGWHSRAAAALLVLAGPIGVLEYGISPVLQRIDLLGLALFVLIVGGGRWSADFELGRHVDPSPATVARGVWALRMAAGTALIVVAFAEKLADPDLARALLDRYPALNVADALGIPVGETSFIRLAGAIEVLFGLLLLSGALPQIIVVAVGVPFNASLWFFGAEELVGHLSVYAAMLVLLVYGSEAVHRPLVAALWPWSRAGLGPPREGPSGAGSRPPDEPALAR